MNVRLSRTAVAIATVASMTISACSTAPASAPAPAPAPEAEAPAEPGVQLSALAPANIKKARPAAPFDLTGNWFIDTSESAEAWRFGPPYPKLTAAAQVHMRSRTLSPRMRTATSLLSARSSGRSRWAALR